MKGLAVEIQLSNFEVYAVKKNLGEGDKVVTNFVISR